MARLSAETIGSYSDEPRSEHYPPLFTLVLQDKANFVTFVGMLDLRTLAADVMRRFRETTAFPSESAVGRNWVPGVAWSDHWSFSKFGMAAVMIADTALSSCTIIVICRTARLISSTTSGFPVSQAGSIVSQRALPNRAWRLLAASPFYLHFPALPCIG